MSRSGRSFAAGLLLLGVAGCASIPPPVPIPFVPPEALGSNSNTDQTAANLAAWAFADPARTRGNPVLAARAVIAIEYLPGMLANQGPYPNASPLVVWQLQAARQEVRQALGIAPDAPPQAVVNAMMTVEGGLFAGNQAAAEAELVPPVFSLGRAETLARLAALPPLPEANVATQRAQFELQPERGGWGG